MPQYTSFWPQWSEEPVFFVLLIALFLSGAGFMGGSAYLRMQEAANVGVSDQSAPTISVSADATAYAKNNIATVDVGITKRAALPTDAQEQATAFMNTFLASMKELGISEDDMQTSAYNVYPSYDYNESPAEIVAYEAQQTLTVKVRDTALVNKVLQTASAQGATNVSGLRFEADDSVAAENEARESALKKARAQAESIADAMGVTLGDVTSYSENKSDGGMNYRYMDLAASGMGGEDAPSVQMGQSEVQMWVYMTYQIN